MKVPIRVMIADDEELFALGVKTALESYPEVALDVITVTETIDDVIEKVRDVEVDILFLDLDWFGEKIAGEDVIRKIRDIKSQLPIIAISAYPNLVKPARDAGASKARTKQGLTGEAILKLIVGVLATDELLEISNQIKKTQTELIALKSASGVRVPIETIRITGIKKTLEQYYRRLWILKEKLAIFGMSADPALVIEIEDTEQLIAQMEKILSELEKGGKENV